MKVSLGVRREHNTSSASNALTGDTTFSQQQKHQGRFPLN
jgi:hypothetical protein